MFIITIYYKGEIIIMKKQQKVMYNGIEIFVPVKYDNPRYKITTNIDKKLYQEIRTSKTLTHKDISLHYDTHYKFYLCHQ